jgi:DNA-binding transcriptional regulator GbsR (MarR family)
MEEIKQLIAKLLMRRAHVKQIMTNLSEELSEEQINDYLEEIFDI